MSHYTPEKNLGAARAKVGNDALGYAPVSEEGRVLKTVFFNRADPVSRVGSANPEGDPSNSLYNIFEMRETLWQ